MLVEVLAYEGEPDAAWDIAITHGCTDRMWMMLARERESAHPSDAIDVYEREVFALIDQKKNGAYRRAVDLLARIRTLAADAGRPQWFDDLLGRVGTEHRAKRNLKKLLDAKGWDPA